MTRARVFREMIRDGATAAEAFTYIDMMWPVEDEDDLP